MWPMLLDYSRDECKRMLRRLELEAYSAIISAFRAQGDLSREKKKVLQDLQQMLSISTERHRAEVRRAVNDEKLTTVADSSISGSSAASEWLIEGRRLVPLLPRLVPQTAFTQTATQAAKEVAEKNAQLMNPALTGNKELANQSSASTPTSMHSSPAAKPSRSSSPTSNVVVLPSGTSIHIKGVLSQEDEEEPQGRRQRRSLSIDGLGAATVSTQTQTARVAYTTASSTPGSASPVKITISKSPQGRTIVSQPGGQPPKVILVTSSGQSSGSSVFQRSMSVPVIRASTSTATSQTGATRTSIIIPGSPGISQGNNSVGGVVTVTTTSITTSSSATVTLPTSVVGSSPVFSPSVNIAKPRPKVVPRPRFSQPQSKPGVIIPMGPTGTQPVAPSPQTIHNIQVKTLPKPQPIQIKQEGGMKIITQSMAAGTSKILPKPSQLAGSPGTPVVVVNAGSSSSSGNATVTMVPKSVGSYTTSGGKVLNITTPGGRVIATTSKASNVVTVNPKTLHLTAVKSAAGGTTVSKPNVIVVQKTQPRRPPLPATLPKGGTTVITNPAAFEKELASFIQKESGRQVSVSISPSSSVGAITGVGGRVPEHRVIITTAGNVDPGRQGVPHRPVADAEARTSSLLAELIQAAGIVPEGSSESSGGVGGNEWFEYDVTEEEAQAVTPDSADATAMQALIGLQNSGAKIVNRTSSADDQQGSVSQEQCYTLEQAMTLLNQSHQTCDVDMEKGSQVHQQIVGKTVVHSSKITTVSSGLPGGVAHQVGQKTAAESDSLPAASGTDVVKVQQEELDPQTGLFYSSLLPRVPPCVTQQVASGSQEEPTFQERVPAGPVSLHHRPIAAQTVLSQPLIVSVSAQHPASTSRPMDLLSSSLAQAQIDLDSYEFGEEVSENYVPEGNIMSVVSDGNSMDTTSQPASSSAEVVDFTSILLGESDSPSEETEQNDADAIPQLTQPASHLPPSVVTSLPSSWAVPNSQPAFLPLENIKDGRTAGIKIVTHEQMAVDPSSFVTGHGSSGSTTNGSFIAVPSGPLAPPPSALVSLSSTSMAPGAGLATLSSPATVAANVHSPSAMQGASTVSVVSSSTTKPEMMPLTASRTFVVESAVPLGMDACSRKTITVSKPVSEMTGVVHILHDGHLQSDVESQRQVDISALSSDAPLSSTIDFSSTGEDEVNLISVPDAATSDINTEGLDPGNPQRHSKRKRKPPSVLEDDAVGLSGNSWVRAASNILMRVSRFRGANREKGELNAAAWFTQPVDPADAPDYYSIIKNPMDFATIRKKLESGQYAHFDDFHADMLLVRSNCFLYNLPSTLVCRDCVQVFNFYQQEIDRLLDKSTNKVHTGSPVKKIIRLDKSPGKS